MKDTRSISRRDWFRLRPRRENKSLGTELQRPAESKTKTIDASNNFTGIDPSELPPMIEATLGPDQIHSLLQDIAEFGTGIQLLQSTSTTGTDQATGRSRIENAERSLMSGAVRRIQVRYQWEASSWIDTISRNDEGFRLVRIQHPSTG